MVQKQLEKDLQVAIANNTKEIRRTSYQYWTHGYQLDSGINAKRAFAVHWRREIIALYEKHPTLEHRTIHRDVAKNNGIIVKQLFHIWSVSGIDLIQICHALPNPLNFVILANIETNPKADKKTDSNNSINDEPIITNKQEIQKAMQSTIWDDEDYYIGDIETDRGINAEITLAQVTAANMGCQCTGLFFDIAYQMCE